MSIQDNPLYDQLFALLQKAEMLEATNIPESRKNINIGNLDISIGMANMINNMGIYTIWDLVHLKLVEILKYRNTHNKHFMVQFIDILDQAIKVLAGELQLPKHDSEVQA